jgi:hypothetical protein
MAKMTADQLIEAFKELTLIELSDFVKKFEEEFDVTAAAPVAVAAAGGAAPAEAAEEKTSLTLFSTQLATRRSRLLKRFVQSPTSAWARLRPWLTQPHRPSSRVRRRKLLKTQRQRSKPQAARSP